LKGKHARRIALNWHARAIHGLRVATRGASILRTRQLLLTFYGAPGETCHASRLAAPAHSGLLRRTLAHRGRWGTVLLVWLQRSGQAPAIPVVQRLDPGSDTRSRVFRGTSSTRIHAVSCGDSCRRYGFSRPDDHLLSAMRPNCLSWDARRPR